MARKQSPQQQNSERNRSQAPDDEWFFPDNEHRELLIQDYYDILNDQKPFQRALAALYAASSHQSDPVQNADEFDESQQATEFEAFLQTWALPQDRGRDDVWTSFAFARQHWPLRLTVAPGGHELPDLGPDLSECRAVLGHQAGVSRVPVIFPPCMLPFVYDPRRPEPAWARKLLGHTTPPDTDPTRGDPHWLRRYAATLGRQLEQSILLQAEFFEGEVRRATPGWSRRPPRHRDADFRRKMALRLYRRAVLGWDWVKIAVQEQRAGDHYVDPGSVRSVATQWARRLRIDLGGQLRR